MCRVVSKFPHNAGEYGLIPNGLCSALAEIGITKEEAPDLADQIAIVIQTGIVTAYWNCCKNLAEARNQRDVYARRVLGQQGPAEEVCKEQDAVPTF